MKLILASSSFKGGGISSYAQELINSYKDFFDIHVIIGDDSLHPLDKEGVQVYHYEMSDTSIDNAIAVLDLINNVIKPDIIINSCARLMTLLIPFLDDRIKVVNVSHSIRYDEADYAGFNSDYADHVVALSSFNKKYLTTTYKTLSEQKCSVIYNFVRSLSNQEELLQEKINNTIPIIVYSGGGTAVKSPEIVFKILLRLLKTNYKFKFYWLGSNTPPLKKILPFKTINDIAPCDNRLVITGKLPREAAINITNKANIFLIPSRREGCPMALLEAMRVGTIPITANYDNACKEIIKDGYNGFVIKRNNIDGFVNRIIDIIKKHNNYIPIYHNSYNTYQGLFAFSKWKSQMDYIICNSTLNHKKRIMFDKNTYLEYRHKQEIRSKLNICHQLLFEYLPSSLAFLKFYIAH